MVYIIFYGAKQFRLVAIGCVWWQFGGKSAVYNNKL
jgi:hypothetical protein